MWNRLVLNPSWISAVSSSVSHTVLLAQANVGIDQEAFTTALQRSSQEADRIAQQWDDQWECVFTASTVCAIQGNDGFLLYPILTTIGVVCAVGALLFFVMQFARDLNEGNLTRPLPELLWPLLVTLLISPSVTFLPFAGSAAINNLAVVILEIRNALELGNDFLLTAPFVVDAVPIRTLQQRAQVMTNAPSIIQSYLKQCVNPSMSVSNAGTPQSPETREACLERQIDSSINLLQAYREFYAANAPFPWVEERIQELQQAQQSSNSGENILTDPQGNLTWAVGPASRQTTQELSVSFQLGFRQTLDVAMLLTALAGPVAVAASVLPVPFANKTITTWLTGFLTIGSARMFYNIITGMAAAVLLRATPSDPTWFSIFLGYVAPVLALGLATGGGIALWNGLQAGVSPLLSIGR